MSRPGPLTAPTKRQETLFFAALAFVVVPALSVAVVAGYGFCIWMYQIVSGPPTA